jgi:acetyl-CoA carboxylase beta subunit
MMPIYPKNQKIIGYVIGEKVWCESCWEEEKPEGTGVPVRVKDLKKNEYVCDRCGGKLPVTYEARLAKQFEDPKFRENLKKLIRNNIEQNFSKKGDETK